MITTHVALVYAMRALFVVGCLFGALCMHLYNKADSFSPTRIILITIGILSVFVTIGALIGVILERVLAI